MNKVLVFPYKGPIPSHKTTQDSCYSCIMIGKDLTVDTVMKTFKNAFFLAKPCFGRRKHLFDQTNVQKLIIWFLLMEK